MKLSGVTKLLGETEFQPEMGIGVTAVISHPLHRAVTEVLKIGLVAQCQRQRVQTKCATTVEDSDV